MKKRNILTILALILIILLIILFIILFVIFLLNKRKDNNENKNILVENENIVENQTSLDENIVEENSDSENVENIENVKNDENSEDTENVTIKENENKSIESSENNSSQSSSSAQPAHVHSWKDHTTQRWVSNIVTVVDTPAQTINGAQLYTLHSDGEWYSDGEIYWFENGFTIDDLKKIIKDKIKNERYIGNYVNRTKTIPAVTHTEDQGYWETYVDYQYCDCGARRGV